MKMKRIFTLMILVLLTSAAVSAQSTTEYKVRNALIGFGTGSRMQGDMESAKWLLISDISGLSLMTAGGIGLVLTDLAYEYFKVSYGKGTTADYWINGSVLGVGAVIFLTGRIFGIILPDKFVINDKAEINLENYAGNLTLDFKIRM